MGEPSFFRAELTSEQRTADMGLTIDPGFVHHRKIATVLRPDAMRFVDHAIERLPALPDHLRRLRINHIYTEAIIKFCAALGVPSLGSLLAAGRGTLFCSTVELEPAADVYKAPRVTSRIVTTGNSERKVDLEYSTKNIVADTARSVLAHGGVIAVVAELAKAEPQRLVFHPLLMGAPWLTPVDGEAPFTSPEWFSYDFFEVFPEDIDEFASVRGRELPADLSVMQSISEGAFKVCLGEILGEAVHRDWGGETSDHFAAHLHLRGKPVTGAFLLKGPARFAPMGLNHLGKNNDQIYRLAQEPAQLLVVQHSHEITAPVRATLRAFAVQPGAPRRYCLMDGRESLRLLVAYEKLRRARKLSQP